MKYHAYATLCAFCGCAERCLTYAGRKALVPLQRLREWAWHAAALENLRTCGLRKVDFHL